MMTICHGSVMVVDADRFEAEYVAEILRTRGLQVVGPFADAEHARSALASEPSVRVAVVAQDVAIAAPDLLGAMRDAGVHVLLLLPSVADTATPLSGDALAKPFAASQVADWAEGMLAVEDGNSRANQNVAYLRAAEADVLAPHPAPAEGLEHDA